MIALSTLMLRLFRKFLIAGAQGTPYEGGLYEFDCFIPLNYPNEPPKVWLKTTAGGRVRFNPNLYADGKGMG